MFFFITKYTYDEYSIQTNGQGYCGSKGCKSKKAILEMCQRFQENHPERIQIGVRRPDNKIIFFYFPHHELKNVTV